MSLRPNTFFVKDGTWVAWYCCTFRKQFCLVRLAKKEREKIPSCLCACVCVCVCVCMGGGGEGGEGVGGYVDGYAGGWVCRVCGGVEYISLKQTIQYCMTTKTVHPQVELHATSLLLSLLTVSTNTKNQDPMNPPRMLILPSVPSSSLNTCMAANVSTASAAAHIHE